MEIKPIAHIRTDFGEKFGIPRQSGLCSLLEGKIVFEPEFAKRESVRGLEEFSHIWLIWQFSENPPTSSLTVRPPRLGGNKRVGVFASRSPFRPNSLGLSCVRLKSIEYSSSGEPVINVFGADLCDKTPIFDIKPYVPLSDCVPDALEGYTKMTKEHILSVNIPEEKALLLPKNKLAALKEILQLDPRPGYDDSPEKLYGLSFAGYNIKFSVKNDVLCVSDIEKSRGRKIYGKSHRAFKNHQQAPPRGNQKLFQSRNTASGASA